MNCMLSLNVQLMPDNITKNVLINPIDPIGVLRMNIAKTFDLPIKGFKIRDKMNFIKDENFKRYLTKIQAAKASRD